MLNVLERKRGSSLRIGLSETSTAKTCTRSLQIWRVTNLQYDERRIIRLQSQDNKTTRRMKTALNIKTSHKTELNVRTELDEYYIRFHCYPTLLDQKVMRSLHRTKMERRS